MKIGESIEYNFFHDGGYIIKRIATKKFELYEIPIFGGTQQYIGEYKTLKLAKEKADV